MSNLLSRYFFWNKPLLHCGHSFHCTCIDIWIKSGKKDCPIWRQDMICPGNQLIELEEENENVNNIDNNVNNNIINNRRRNSRNINGKKNNYILIMIIIITSYILFSNNIYYYILFYFLVLYTYI